MIKYPNLEKRVYELGTPRQFAQNAGISHTALVKILNGNSDPHKSIIDAILKVSGLPYDVAFSETVIKK